jgi:hypothetical protein
MKFTLVAFLSLATLFASAQRQYSKEWKRVDSLMEKAGLLKSALKEVNTI